MQTGAGNQGSERDADRGRRISVAPMMDWTDDP